jgi:hypothetical protein
MPKPGVAAMLLKGVPYSAREIGFEPTGFWAKQKNVAISLLYS